MLGGYFILPHPVDAMQGVLAVVLLAVLFLLMGYTFNILPQWKNNKYKAKPIRR